MDRAATADSAVTGGSAGTPDTLDTPGAVNSRDIDAIGDIAESPWALAGAARAEAIVETCMGV